MNDDEPTYEYVRGYGWMPCDIPTLSRVIGKYQWTLQFRKPNPDEYFWCTLSDDTLELLMGYIQEADDAGVYDDGTSMPGARLCDHDGDASKVDYWGSAFCVISRILI